MSIVQKDHVIPELYQTTYNREDCRIGIVHLGYGAFHRAHQAIYVDDYMEKTGDLRWGIAAVNLRAADSGKFNKSSTVDDGYVIKTTDVDGSVELRKVRSHLTFSDWSSSAATTEELLSSPDVHAVTITVTESGYYLTGSGELDLSSYELKQELNSGHMATVYGYLANALGKRKAAIDKPITILCCDNIRSNGKMLQSNFLTYLEAAAQSELIDWVKENVSFPCSMVDRITPHATPLLLDEIAVSFGTIELDPIHAEKFTQWVLEDRFAGLMPDLIKTGVEIVQDVDPYEEAKIRILNGGHTALAYFGALAGYNTFDEAMRDPILRQHFDNFENKEVLLGLKIDLPFDRRAYLQKVSDRFCNHAIADQLERICMDGYSKMQLYIRPTLRSCLSQGIDPVHTLDCIASWYVYARRYKAGKTSVSYHEPYWEQLAPMLENGHEAEFAACSHLWGNLPEAYPKFPEALVSAIKKMEKSWLA